MSDIINDTKSKMQKSVDNLSRELANISAGRANSNLLNGVTVDYYGAPTPVQQLASISVPEARLLVIAPYDKSSVGNIEKAINAANLGVNPSSDGEVIRISVPALTEERRKELAREVSQLGEQSKVSIRNVRREGIDTYRTHEKDNKISEDQLYKFEQKMQDLTDKYTAEIDKAVENKEKELMEI